MWNNKLEELYAESLGLCSIKWEDFDNLQNKKIETWTQRIYYPMLKILL